MGNKVKTGVLLVNLGTPTAPTAKAVKTFLGQFLHDHRVVDLPRMLWCPVLHGVILPFRSPKVAKLYQSIWWEEGSPLMVVSRRQQAGLSAALQEAGINMPVALGMSYGEPSIGTAWQELKDAGVDRVIILPMYPQYSVSTTASVFDSWARLMKQERCLPAFRFIRDYHDHRGYIQALAESVRDHWEAEGRTDLLLLSYHGIPKRFEDQGDPYGHQCHRTSELVAAELGLERHEWRTTFQSRFGREPWLQPYTDETMKALPGEGTKSVSVICPAFSADCLETLEEIAEQNKEIFMEAGGEAYHYIPALNDNPAHIRMMMDLVCRELV
ncbi:ferrochelatase [Oceanisphaera arctica]|uniref:Ferrochelatase n=1 Tax=Oceanisphaera arctica TaxID=641510 RepID=A0A2P5TR36_9GAMM|nr:ferrochelatase [Oceanisphaera arctica]PPL18276.1 ferrochelatase [Oceanisphaera arctica]GHA12255.1 ferrochelatase [Oceanisphaera arctica]